MEQGVHVEGINFFTGFCVEGHTHAIRKKDRVRPKRNNALWSAGQLGIKLPGSRRCYQQVCAEGNLVPFPGTPEKH